jgi:hypothetical protein
MSDRVHRKIIIGGGQNSERPHPWLQPQKKKKKKTLRTGKEAAVLSVNQHPAAHHEGN